MIPRRAFLLAGLTVVVGVFLRAIDIFAHHRPGHGGGPSPSPSPSPSPVLIAPVLSASVSGAVVTLTWTDGGDEDSYVVKRGLSPEVTDVTVATLPANTLMYQDAP